MDAENLDQVLACLRITSELKLCPNRVWSVAGINLPKLLPNLDFSRNQAHGPSSDQDRQDGLSTSAEQDNHEACAYDFCEFSARNFTSVQQRHECRGSDCMHVPGRFPTSLLDEAIRSQQPTVWSLNGGELLERNRPYMAISHVWSDGTGSGAWKDGHVNDCLYSFFRGIAKLFDCEGIWWDTICIPNEKAARAVAIAKMHENYLDARITLVHDCFLRNWEWDPETACFGILMSPWFSRGWTALELVNSPKVKIMFKGPHGRGIIKDLDEEILAKNVSDTLGSPREEATRIIQMVRWPPRNLKGRARSEELDVLLTVMGPRHTSWPKDKAIISALMFGISPLEGQQDTYRKILRKCGWISQGHLFHTSTTMSQGFNWCPTSLFDLPVKLPSTPLKIVSTDGDVQGDWRSHGVKTSLADNLLWEHDKVSVTQLRVLASFASSSRCRLLAEPGTEPVERAIFVKVSDSRASESKIRRYEYIGAVRFRRRLPSDGWRNVRATICGSTHGAGDRNQLPEDPRPRESREGSSNALNDSIWKDVQEGFRGIHVSAADAELNPQQAQSRLHLAAERGDEQMMRLIEEVTSATDMQLYLQTRGEKGRTPLHLAAWSGSARVVERLLRLGCDAGAADEDKNLPLHIASRMGFEAVVKLLLEADVSHLNTRARNGLTAAHFAAMNGHGKVLVLFINEGADLTLNDNFGMALIHYAASIGDASMVGLLREHGADVNHANAVGWTPLHLAAMNGHHEVIDVLLHHDADAAAVDKYGWKPETFAKVKGLLRQHTEETEETEFSLKWSRLHLLAIENPHRLPMALETIDSSECLSPPVKERTGETSLPWAAKHGLLSTVRWLLDRGADIEERDGTEDGRTSLSMAAEQGHDSIVELLLSRNANIEEEGGSGRTPLGWAAKGLQSSMIKRLERHGADIDRPSRTGHTALNMAVKLGDEAAVRQLIACGANVRARDSTDPRTLNRRKTPLDRAIRGKSLAMLQLLMKPGGGSDFYQDYCIALPCAVSCDNEAAVGALLDLRADSHSDASDKFSALHLESIHLASKRGNTPIVEMLLDWRARSKNDVMVRCPAEELAALYSAIYYGRIDLVRALVRKGAQVNPIRLSHPNLISPLGLACWRMQTDMIQLLRDHGAVMSPHMAYDPKEIERMMSTGKAGRRLSAKLREEVNVMKWRPSSFRKMFRMFSSPPTRYLT